MATLIAKGIENTALGQVQFEPAPHTHNYTYNDINLNNAQNLNPRFYAPVQSGLKGDVLMSGGQGNEPAWRKFNTLINNNSVLNEWNCFFVAYDPKAKTDKLYQLIIDDTNFLSFLHKIESSVPQAHSLLVEIAEERGENKWRTPGFATEMNYIMELIYVFIKDPVLLDTHLDNTTIIALDYETFMNSFPIGHKGYLFLSYSNKEQGIETLMTYVPVEFVLTTSVTDPNHDYRIYVFNIAESYVSAKPELLFTLLPPRGE